jgi:peptidoglycan hydrolase CwlO-like protein
LQTYEAKLGAAQAEVGDAESAVEKLKEELKSLNAVFEEKTRELDAVKREHDMANKALEKVLKDISSRVRADSNMITY